MASPPSKLWALLVSHESMDALKDAILDLDESPATQESVRRFAAESVAAYEGLGIAPAPSALAVVRRALAGLQLVAYNFLQKMLGEAAFGDVLTRVLCPILAGTDDRARSLQLEAMRTCVQFVKSYEESIDPFSEPIITFCVHTLTNKPENDGLVFSCLEFIRLFAGVSPEILALRGNELLLAAFGLLLAAGNNPNMVTEGSEALAQLLLLALPKEYGELLKKSMEDEESDEEDDEEDDEDDEESDEEEDEDDEELHFTCTIRDADLMLRVSTVLMDWERKFAESARGDETNIDVVLSLLCALSGQCLEPAEHAAIAKPLLDEVIARVRSAGKPTREYTPISFLGNLLQCSLPSVVDGYFVDVYGLLVQTHKDAKAWKKGTTSSKNPKKKQKIYVKLRNAIISTLCSLVEKGDHHLLDYRAQFFADTGPLFGDPTLYAEYFVALYAFFAAQNNYAEIDTLRDGQFTTTFKQISTQLVKPSVSPAIKALIIEAYEKLATSAQPLMEQHWDAMYTSILEALAQNRTELAVPAFYSLSKIIDSNSEHSATKKHVKAVVDVILATMKPSDAPNSTEDADIVVNALEALTRLLNNTALNREVLPGVVEHILGSLEQRVWFDDDVDYANARIDFLLLCIANTGDAVDRKAIKALGEASVDFSSPQLSAQIAELQKVADGKK